jgi:hypothetical protein
MTVQAVATAQYKQQATLAKGVAAQMTTLWRQMDPDVLDLSWIGIIDRLLALLTGGQYLAASSADRYLTTVLNAQGIDASSRGSVNARAFAGIASDGRDLESLLRQPLISTKIAIGNGASTEQAMTTGLISLDMIARTQIADAGRTSVGAGMVARPQATAYVRMLNPPACARCVILAGRVYRWSKGFQRHPRCDCIHIPTRENVANDLTTDPDAYIDSLDQTVKEKILTKAGAQAYDDGANLNQIVNARRGMQKASMYGRELLVTTEGTTRRGLAGQRMGARRADAVPDLSNGESPRRVHRARAPRLMPEQIYEIAESREDAIRLLKRNAYIF